MNQVQLITIADCLGKGSNRYTKIRHDARIKCRQEGRLKKCERCSYDKHVEVCHIKPIYQFAITDSIEIVNASDNILVLCPNCHWEHDHGLKQDKTICPQCRKYKYHSSLLCQRCANKNVKETKLRRKVVRPDKETLQKQVEEVPMTRLALLYGVSNTAIRKWCNEYGIILGNRRGYWAKKMAIKPALTS